MAKKGRKGGWYGEPGRHAQAARGIKTKGVTPGERELRRQTSEYLAGREPVEKPDQPIVADVTDELVEDNTEWAADKVEDRLNELGFWNEDFTGLVLAGDDDPPQSEKEIFNRIVDSDAPDDVYFRLKDIVARDNAEDNLGLSGDQIDRVANDAVLAGVKVLAKAAWRDMYEEVQ